MYVCNNNNVKVFIEPQSMNREEVGVDETSDFETGHSSMMALCSLLRKLLPKCIRCLRGLPHPSTFLRP